MIDNLLKWAFRIIGLRQSIRVRCHSAYFGGCEPRCMFVTMVSMSPKRDVEINHICFESEGEIPVRNLQRKLPVRLQPDESRETWIEESKLGRSFQRSFIVLQEFI